MNRPNFFIVGAPRCGTTAMYRHLKEHPDIYMSPLKEPHFFGADMPHRFAPSLDEYLSLFAEADTQKVIGEASTGYLMSESVAAEIKEFNPEARIMVMLRDPVDMMFSLHSYRIWGGIEREQDFDAALRADAEREKAGGYHRDPSTGKGRPVYRGHARFTQQVQRYFNVFGRDRVHVVIYDDFTEDIARVYRDVLSFLSVDPEFQPGFRSVNQNMETQSRAIHSFLVDPPRIVQKFAQRLLPRCRRVQLFAALRYLNTRHKPRPGLDPALRGRLAAEFAPEVERLSELLGRDLTHWSGRPCRQRNL